MAAVRSRVPADRWSQPLSIGGPVDEWLDSAAARTSAGRYATDVRASSGRTCRRRVPCAGGSAHRCSATGSSMTAMPRSSVGCRRRGSASELAVVAALRHASGDADRLAATNGPRGRGRRTPSGSVSPRCRRRRSSCRLPGGGPVLTWRAVNDLGEPPLANWALSLGDIELF